MTTPKFQQKYRIPSARATWHDYNGGMYFVTICTKDKIGYFGKVVDGKMRLNGLGKECERQIEITSKIRPDMDISIPVYVVMPNHIYLIVCIDKILETPRRDAMPRVSENTDSPIDEDAKHGVSTGAENRFGAQRKNLASVIRGLKSAVTMYARENNIPFAWQTRFHDRIIRNQSECNRIADYIDHNPETWINDTFYNEENNYK